MDRADMIKEAVLFGLEALGQEKQARIMGAVQFSLRADGRIVAQCPRHRLSPDVLATEDVIAYLRTSIEDGLRYSGFVDWIELLP